MKMFYAALFLFSSLDKSITSAGHGAGSSRGDRAGIPLFQARLHTHSTIHSYHRDLAGIEPATSEPLRQRSYLWATGLLLEHVKELIFDCWPVSSQ